MNKTGKSNVAEGIAALVIGFLIMISIPEAKSYLDSLVNAVVTGLILGIIIAVVIFAVWYLLDKN